MGNSFSKAIQTKIDEFKAIQMENALKQRQSMLAMSFASGKEFFHWYAAFYTSILFFLPVIASKKKSIVPIIPLYPLGFIVAYQYDMFYGNKMNRVRQEAERLIKEEPHRFYFPDNSGIISKVEYNKLLNINQKSTHE